MARNTSDAMIVGRIMAIISRTNLRICHVPPNDKPQGRGASPRPAGGACSASYLPVSFLKYLTFLSQILLTSSSFIGVCPCQLSGIQVRSALREEIASLQK